MTSQLIYDGHIVDTLVSEAAIAAELYQLYAQHRKRGDRLPLWCAKEHRGRMYLRIYDGQLWAVHYPGEGGPKCRVLIGGQSPAHRHMVQYAAGAAERAGFNAVPEYSTGNHTRLDLLIEAPALRYGIEAQLSAITDRDAKARTTKSTRAGVPPVWIASETRTFPYAPNIGFNRETDWTPGVPPPGSVTALHLQHIEPWECTTRAEHDCPIRPGNICGAGTWHPWYHALRGWTLDRSVTGIGEGELSFLQTAGRRPTVRIVPSADLLLYRELTGHDGAFNPGGIRAAAPPVVLVPTTRECTAERLTEIDVYTHCILCGNPLLLFAPGRDLCERCHMDGAGMRPVQLPLFLTPRQEVKRWAKMTDCTPN